MAKSAKSSKKQSDPRPIGGYVALLATYSVGAAAATGLLGARRVSVRRPSVGQFILLALATQHLSRLITKDSITAPIRAPFTRFVDATGEGEVNEEVIGTGVRHAVGELLTCPYCIGQWVASALVVGTLVAPDLTEGFTTICALARVSDYLQTLHGYLQSKAE